MRNVTLLCIALLIAVGVLAKNPPASAPSLAASLVSFPVAPKPQPAPEPIKTEAEAERTFAKSSSLTAEAVGGVSHGGIVSVDAEPLQMQPDLLVPASAEQKTEVVASELVEQIVSVAELEQPLSTLANHSNANLPAGASSDELGLYLDGNRFAVDGSQAMTVHEIVKDRIFGNASDIQPVFSNSTISETISRQPLTRYFEPLDSLATVSNSFVRKAEFVQAPLESKSFPIQERRITYAPDKVAIAFNAPSFGVLEYLARSVPEVPVNAEVVADSNRPQATAIELASMPSLSDDRNLNYRRPVSLNEMIASSLTKTIEQPILQPPTLAKPKAIERPATLTTSASISSSVSARRMFKDTVSPMLAKSVLIERSKEIEPLKINLSAPTAMTPPMFSEAEAKRYKAAVMPVAPSKFSINIAPDPGSVIMSSIDDVKPALVKSATANNANASPARFQLNIQDGGYCDTNFVGPTITFAQTAELTLDDLLYQIHNRFGINFLMGPDLGKLPINIKSGSIPWNTLLRSQLFVSGVRATCLGQNTIQLIKNESLPKLQSGEAVKTTFLKLKYLQPTSGGNVDVAGQRSSRGGGGGDCGGGGGSGAGGGGLSSGGGQQSCGNFEKLIIEIEKILGIRSMSQSSIGGGGGGSQGGSGQQTEEMRTNRSVTVIPGRNILMVRANDEELSLIEEIIKRADRAPFQVVIKGLIYTANQDKLKDVGVQTTITEESGRTTGGIFGHTLGSAGTLFDFSTIIGTFDFNVQATALQQNGVISIKSRPFATVLDGETTDLTVGRQVPVLIQAINPTGGIPGSLQILQAANLLSVTPHVIDDDNGNPIGVNLELQLDSNEVDTSVISQGVPSVSVRSIQTRLMLNPDQTAILGGFTLDSDSRSISKTPGLGDIPIIGELFKRRVKQSQINRLYFAISVSIIPFPGNIRPVDVPGATPQPPSITPEMKMRGDKGEPKQVTGP